MVDLFRAQHDVSSVRRSVMLCVIGVPAVVGLAVSAHPHDAWGWSAWCASALLVIGWIVGSGQALSNARREDDAVDRAGRARRGLAAAIAYGAFTLGVAILGLAGTRAGRLGWLDHLLSHSILDTANSERALTGFAMMLVQVATANILIRMLLNLVGVPAQVNEKTLRGGRVLGPMERLVIVGLGLAGSLTGATVVVAAKALLRFPELRPHNSNDSEDPEPQGGASDVTEYFLIGSFASWILAIGCVAMASA